MEKVVEVEQPNDDVRIDGVLEFFHLSRESVWILSAYEF